MLSNFPKVFEKLRLKKQFVQISRNLGDFVKINTRKIFSYDEFAEIVSRERH